jgi:predicted acylesterase/phospholipase RssA
MSTKEALAEYDNCAAKIFSKDNHKSWSISEKFRATALKEAIQDLVKRRGLGESMRDPENPQKGKAFVCVMPSDNIGKTDIVRSFDGDDGAQDNWDEHVKIWEAARATTAASSFFKPQRLGGGASARTYIDAAIGVNNPVSILLPEAAKEFGAGRRFGCVISIGTGTRDVKLERSAGGLQSILKFRGVVYYVDLMKTLKNLATDAEEAHRQLESKLLPFPGTYYRFNIPDAAAQVKLHHYLKIPELKSSAEKYLSSEPVAKQVRQIAKALKTDEFDHGLTLGHLRMCLPSCLHINPVRCGKCY